MNWCIGLKRLFVVAWLMWVGFILVVVPIQGADVYAKTAPLFDKHRPKFQYQSKSKIEEEYEKISKANWEKATPLGYYREVVLGEWPRTLASLTIPPAIVYARPDSIKGVDL